MKGFIGVYGVQNNMLHVTADFAIFVGKEEIDSELRQLNVNCEYIQKYLESCGLQNEYLIDVWNEQPI